jgi:predicted sulfurtransferase
MKNEKEIEDDVEICDGCGNEFPEEEMQTCPDCLIKICDDCWELHSDTHLEGQ